MVQLGWSLAAPAPIGFDAVDGRRTHGPEPLYAPAEGSLLTIAPSAMGKGRNALIPTLITYDGPIVVVDVKGENALVTARKRARFGPVAIVDPFRLTTQSPDTFNPMDVAGVTGWAVEEFSLMLVEMLRADHGSSLPDPFWETRAGMLIAGVLAYILAHSPPEERHLGTLRRLLSADDVDYGLAVLLDTVTDIHPYARAELAQYLQICSDKTRPSVLSTAQQHHRLLGDPAVAASLSRTSFDIQRLFDGEPMTIYLVLPPTRLKSHAALLRLWVGSLLGALLERRQAPAVPTMFLIDEAAQLGTLGALRTATTLMRSYGVRVWSFWQDLSQLVHLYPDDWQTIVNNAAVVQAFGASTWLMARELTDVIGGIAPERLLSLGKDEQVLAMRGGSVQIARKLDYLSDSRYKQLFDANPMYGAR